MAEKQHLITCILFLLLLVIALITMLVLQRFQGKTPIVFQAEPLALPAPMFFKVPPTKPRTTVTQKTRNVCETPECIQLAYQLHNYQDPSVDPCQDFYKFSCGKYNEHTTLEGAILSSKVKIIQQLVTEFLHKNKPTTSRSENAMHLLYKKCQDFHSPSQTQQDHLTIKKWKEVVQVIQSFGPWPILDRNWDESKFNLNDMLVKIAEYGFTNFGFFSILNKQVLIVGPIPNPFLRSVFKQNVPIILINAGIKPDQALMSVDLKNFEELQETFGQVTQKDKLEQSDFATMQNQTPSIDFERILKTFIKSENKNDKWSKIKGKILFGVEILPSGQRTGLIEKLLTTTPKRTIANFVLFHVLNKMIDMNSVKDCENLVHKTLPLASLRVYVRNHFNKKNLKMATEMVDDMKQSFIEIIQNSKWLNEKTKGNAIEKVEMIEKLVGYPEEMEEHGALDKTFELLKLSPDDSLFTITSKIMKFKIEEAFEYIAGALRLAENEALDGNASYLKPRNSLTVYIPLLDVYDASYPKYATIAGVGNVIGHEIGHGFDPDGRNLNGTGQDEDWWTLEDSLVYDKRAQCLVDQYNNYDDPHFGRKLNGTTTLNEMAADNIGSNMAWNSYESSDMSREPSIIGFEDYNLDKLFFRISALNWCSRRPTHTLGEQLQRRHPTHSFRINGAVANMKSFAEAFNCPVGSPMNPEKKCKLF